MLRSSPAKAEVAASARGLVRRAFKGSLATIDRGNGYPYVSLVTLATDAAGAPTVLISKLARHTANLAKDGRASIMVEETGALADPFARGEAHALRRGCAHHRRGS
jgi:putative heme iron utilization protein